MHQVRKLVPPLLEKHWQLEFYQNSFVRSRICRSTVVGSHSVYYMGELILGVILQYIHGLLYAVSYGLERVNPLSIDGHYSGYLANLSIFFCRIGKFNTCTFTTLILKNLHHWFVFISDIRTYQVFSGPCISQCIAFNWKALMLVSPHFS